MPDLIRTRETTDEERRARARERIARDVRLRRLPPDVLADPETLDYAYSHGHEGELQALSAELEQLQAEDAERAEAMQASADLRHETDRVLAEWEADRRAKAKAEACKRLGWDAT